MNFLLRKTIGRIFPIILGFCIGLLISYQIRHFLRKPSLCGQVKHVQTSIESNSNQNSKVPILSSNDNGIMESSKLCDMENANCDAVHSSKSIKKNTNKPRELLFVGVMSANVFLDTRAKAVWETWASSIPGKVVFFTGGNDFSRESKMENETLPIVPLPDVDDSYPPQKKSFMMLKYMFEHYGDDYEWFMRADDDVYVRADKLTKFLRSIDSRHFHFIGQAGKGNEIEKGTLKLAHNENFCMGGPGILLSRPLLKKIAPNVHQCLKNMYSTHEDVELGRCVQRFAGVSCTWAFEMQTIFHHNASGDLAFTGKLKRREVHKAITLHPIKNFKYMYRLHFYFQNLKIQDLLHERILTHQTVLAISPSDDLRNLENAFDVFSEWSDLNITDLKSRLSLLSGVNNVIPWDFLEKGVYTSATKNPKVKLSNEGREALEDVVREVMDVINSYSQTRGRIVDFKEIIYGYRRIHPLRSADYILDLLLTYKKYRGKKMTIPVRRHVYVQRKLSPLQFRPVTPCSSNIYNFKHSGTHDDASGYVEANPSKQINKLVMIVPLSGRYDTFIRFLENFGSTCTALVQESEISQFPKLPSSISPISSFEMSLIVVFFGPDDEKEKFLFAIQRQRERLLGIKRKREKEDSLCRIKMVQMEGEFSRGLGLEAGVSQCQDDELLLLIDVDLTFTADVIKRTTLNTRKGFQAYFPIVFSQYNPKFYDKPISSCKSGECQLDSDFGFWREFGYGIAAFYKSDFKQAGGFDTKIKGWGMEDVELFDKFLFNTNLTLFRAPDPHLVHLFHETKCDSKLSKLQYEMCLGSQASTMGSTKNLVKYLHKLRNNS